MEQDNQNAAPLFSEKERIKLTCELEQMGKIIVDAAYKVHKELGPGLLEKVYEICLAHEIQKTGITVFRQTAVPIIYDGLKFEESFRLDLLVGNEVIIEVKAVDIVNPVWQAQILSHLRLANKPLGYLINFNVPLIKNGIKRYINKVKT